MKHNIFSNDKTTAKDEVIITIFSGICFIIGIILCITKPSFWIFSSSITTVSGVMLLVIGIIFIPIIIYRLSENYKSTDKEIK